METRASYGTAVEIRHVCLKRAEEDWQFPTGAEIKAALGMTTWSGEEFARRINVDGRTVRRWVLDEKTIPYAAWCVLCAEAGLGEIWK